MIFILDLYCVKLLFIYIYILFTIKYTSRGKIEIVSSFLKKDYLIKI